MDIGLNNKFMEHDFKIIPREEILANRSNAYKFIDFNNEIYFQRLIKIWKPNMIQKLFIKLRIIKDPRYNGKKINKFLIDEMGHWQFKNKTEWKIK